MTNTNKKTASKTTKVSPKINREEQIKVAEQALANVPVEMVPLSQLATTPLNVRKKLPDSIKLQELADSIRSVGVLQNLVVCKMPDGMLGVAAGGRRLSALNILLNAQAITGEYAVPVKTVSEEMAKIISTIENFQREDMHPADQIVAFWEMNRDGRTAAQIGGLMGYTTKHVEKFLRLAGMAPDLLEELAEDKINIDQLQALSASEDHERQLSVWKNAYGYYRTPKELREAVLKGEVSAEGHRQLEYVGRVAYEQAGGGFRYDLFSDEGFITDTVLLDTLTRQKLTDVAAGIAQAEGWSWSEGRADGVSTYGEDAHLYLLLSQPDSEFTELETARLEELEQQLADLSEQCEQDQAEHESMDHAAAACRKEIAHIKDAAKIRVWSEDVRARGGVVVSLYRGEVSVRRGVMKRCDLPEIVDDENNSDVNHLSSVDNTAEVPQAKPLSAVLAKSLSSERTLAVQAALAEQPQMALVIFVHDCLKSTFDHRSYTLSTLKVSLHVKTGLMLDNAPTSADGLAMQHLTAMHDAWQKQLPLDWHKSWDWLLTWDTQALINVMGYCLARTLDGASERLSDKGGKAGKDLEPVEALLNFTLRDWWVPTKANFFGRISKEQITDSLLDAGLNGAATDALKMKKGDAAELAEDKVQLTSWVPDCLLPVSVAHALPESDAVTVSDADTPSETTGIAA